MISRQENSVQWNSSMRSKSLSACAACWSACWFTGDRRLNSGGGLTTWTTAPRIPTRPAPHMTASIIRRVWSLGSVRVEWMWSMISLVCDNAVVISTISSSSCSIAVVIVDIVADRLIGSYQRCYHCTHAHTKTNVISSFQE